MTEQTDQMPGLQPEPDVSRQTPPGGAGSLLRQARQAQNLTIEQVAERLKVSVPKLQALEADQYELLSDPVFMRALAASVCRLLKIDAEPVLDGLPRPKPSPIRTDDEGLNASFRESHRGLGRSWFMHDRTSIGIAVLVLLAAALAIVIWPRSHPDASDQAGASLTQPSPAPVSSAAEPAVTPAPTTAPLTPVAPASAPVPAEQLTPAAHAVAVDAMTAQPNPNAAPAGTPVLTLKASGTSWVQVTDAKGVTQLHKTLQAGEQISVSGELPLSVVLGRADLIAVTVRNQVLDLGAVTKNNVARFEVK